MTRCARYLPTLLLILGGFCLPSPIAAQAFPALSAIHLDLLSRYAPEGPGVQLDNADWAWLRRKRTLVIGTATPDFPPLDIVSRDGGYDGLSADIASLLKDRLGVEVRILQLPTRQAALQALEAGRIDLLAGADNADCAGRALVLSTPYASDQPTLLKRQGEPRPFPADLRGLTIATAEDHLHQAEVRRRYPGAHVVPYRSPTQAMAALAFGQVDAYLGDALSAQYLINHFFFNYVRFERFPELRANGFGFALRRDDRQLLGIVNRTLASISRQTLSGRMHHWSGAGLVLPGDRISLSAREAHWLKRHPQVRLLINDDLAPVAFFDADGNFNGVAADVLTAISLRTGLRFKVERTNSFANLARKLEDGDAELAIMSPSLLRGDALRFTRPFISSPLALVTRRRGGKQAFDPERMKGKRLALFEGHVAFGEVRNRYPDIHLLSPPTTLDSLAMVERGEADGAIVALSVARYYTRLLYGDSLRVSGLLDVPFVTGNFAMRRGETELQAILDKALLRIPPDELNSIAIRWRANGAMRGQTWRDYREVIAAIVCASLLLVLLVLLIVLRQRRELRRRRRNERAMAERLQQIQTLSDSIPQAIYVRDRQGRLLSSSSAYARALGIDMDEMRGSTALQLPAEIFEAAPRFHESYLRAMRSGEPLRQQCEAIIGGHAHWIDHWVQPYRDRNGEIAGVVCGWFDISEQVRLIEELEAARGQADEANRSKTAFLATMSHEIRTPLNAVMGTLELALKRAARGELDRAGLKTAYASAQSLLELIGDVLDIARIESGHLSLAPKRVNLRELIESVARVFESLALRKNLGFPVEIDASLDRDVFVDPSRLRQVLSNLLSNAIKFTERGQVRLTASAKPLSESLMHVHLQVKDSGIGVSLADQQRLFRPFAQVDSQRGATGAGLGLVICRSLCDMMGGTLHFSSVKDAGTQVDVELKLHLLASSAAPQPAAIPPSAARRNLRVLVVDDHEANRELLCQQLAFLGHRTEEAENGAVALRRWRDGDFALVVSDCHMPLMDGCELARRLRAEEAAGQRAPCLILGLTADVQVEEIERCLQSGMDDCLSKPIGLEQLEARLDALLGRQEHSLPAAPPASAERTVAKPPASSPRFEKLLQLTGGSSERIMVLVEKILRSNREDLDRLRSHARDGDIEALRGILHRLQGVAHMVGEVRLMESCSALSRACAEGLLDGSPPRDLVLGVEYAILELEQTYGAISS